MKEEEELIILYLLSLFYHFQFVCFCKLIRANSSRTQTDSNYILMKHIISILLLFACCFAFGQTEIFPGSFEELETAAKKKHKPYIVNFSTSWCGYCKKFDREVMPDSSFSSLVNQQFLFGRVDGDAQKATVAKYKVRGYPTFIIFNEKGEEIKRFSGYVGGQSFIQSLNYLGYEQQTVSILSFDEYEVKKGEQLSLLTSKHDSNELFEKAMKTGKDNDLLAKEDLMIDNPKKENKIGFYYQLGGSGFDIKQLQKALDVKIITTDEAHELLLNELLATKKKIDNDYLTLINSLLLQEEDDYYLLDTKAFIYYKLGQTKDGEQAAKHAKKIASKKKLNYSATELLIKLN
jgi:thioredoxin-related protein